MRDYKIAVKFPDGTIERTNTVEKASTAAVQQSISNITRGGDYYYPGVAAGDYLDRLRIELVARQLEGRL